jgi:hypothetical protein
MANPNKLANNEPGKKSKCVRFLNLHFLFEARQNKTFYVITAMSGCGHIANGASQYSVLVMSSARLWGTDLTCVMSFV